MTIHDDETMLSFDVVYKACERIRTKLESDNNLQHRTKLTNIDDIIKPPKTWKRFVDDIFAIMKKNTGSTSHNELNSIEPDINFSSELEQDGQMPF